MFNRNVPRWERTLRVIIDLVLIGAPLGLAPAGCCASSRPEN